MLHGPLSAVSSYSYDGVHCFAGVTGTTDLGPIDGSRFFVIVGQRDLLEGSYGRDSLAGERPEDVATPGCDAALSTSACGCG